ncbi:MAG: response regulator, partial [Clostridia bacterium]|nr:response regulator [Deltaproteobacteria bacterium]
MAYQLLVADDSATMQRVVQTTFANEDFQVTAVDNGQAAVATAKSLRPQLALVDVGMPGMDGYAVCQALKSDAETALIPVVLLGSNFQPIDEARAQSVGAVAHVMKPFETQALIDRVKTLLGQATSPAIRSIPAAGTPLTMTASPAAATTPVRPPIPVAPTVATPSAFAPQQPSVTPPSLGQTPARPGSPGVPFGAPSSSPQTLGQPARPPVPQSAPPPSSISPFAQPRPPQQTPQPVSST